MTNMRMLIDATHPEETRVAVLNGNQLEELDVESSTRPQLKGSIYLAKVTRVEPSLQAAFVDYGGNRHGFLAFSEIHPDYYQIPVDDREQIIAEEEEARAAEAAKTESEDVENGNTDSGRPPPKAVEIVGGEDNDEVEAHRKRKTIRRYKIQEVIKRRQILLIQVVKEERGNKGAALTTYLSLAGRYCVLMPNTGKGGGISKRITDSNDRKRLKLIISELKTLDGMAIIVRTAGAKRSKAEIKRDFEYLTRLWNDIRDLTLESAAPTLIHEEANIIKRALRDMYSRDMGEILVEGDFGYRMAKDLMKRLIPSHAKKVQRYKDPIIPLFSRHQIENQLDSMIGQNVKLKSGGYVVINSTEALIAVDVNSGRATRGRNIEETALKTNLEAATEIARQLRLRDLAGLIVIDFIDMDIHRNQIAVERRLKDTMRKDRAKIQIGRISPFGLLELSRQRLRPSITETTTDVCVHCKGSGIIRSVESTALHILRGIEEEGANFKSDVITVNVPSEASLYMLNHKRNTLAEIEKKYNIKIIINEESTLSPPDFRIETNDSEHSKVAPANKKKATNSSKDELSSNDGPNKRRRRRVRQKNKERAEEHVSKSDADNEKKLNSSQSEISSKDSSRKSPKKSAKRRRTRRQKINPKQDQKEASSVEVSGDKELVPTMNSKSNGLVEGTSNKHNEPRESTSEIIPATQSNVTIVGSEEQATQSGETRKGWWQKLVE